MAFFKTLCIVSVAALASAVPQAAINANTSVDVDKTASESTCGNNQKLACCNSGEDLISANCLTLPFFGLPLHQACGSNIAACCDTGDASDNFINLELNCFSLPL